jgi:uncharacterized RDD family membrane protein YckC
MNMTTMNETKTNTAANISRRIIAWGIDNMIMGFFTLIDYQGDNSIWSHLIIMFFYYFIMEVIWDRTIGKYIMGIMIVDASRESYDEMRMIKLVFIRTLCRYIPLDHFSFAFNNNRQFWHDNLSNTKVILRKSRSETYFTGAPN